MSYCRWSSDGGKCDVYVYEHCEGHWAIHVAGRKRWLRNPELVYLGMERKLPYWMVFILSRIDSLCTWIGEQWWIPVDQKYAGKSYEDPTPLACAARLIELRNAGLSVPQRAIDCLVLEANDIQIEKG
jgi:hypothetical protein